MTCKHESDYSGHRFIRSFMRKTTMKREAGRGFTLPELMLCMLIISVISTYSIPKALAAQQNLRKKAVLRETIAALSEVVYLGGLTGALSPDIVDSAPSYILSRI